MRYNLLTKIINFPFHIHLIYFLLLWFVAVVISILIWCIHNIVKHTNSRTRILSSFSWFAVYLCINFLNFHWYCKKGWILEHHFCNETVHSSLKSHKSSLRASKTRGGRILVQTKSIKSTETFINPLSLYPSRL